MSRHKLTNQLVINRRFEWRFHIKIATIQHKMLYSSKLTKSLRSKNKIAYLKWKMGKIWDQIYSNHQNRSFCQVLDHIFFCLQFAICNLQEKRPGCLFSFWITKKVLTLFFPSYFFQCHKPTHVFKSKIVGVDWRANKDVAAGKKFNKY